MKSRKEKKKQNISKQMREITAESNPVNIVRILTVTVLLIYIIMFFLIWITDGDKINAVSLDDYITVDIRHADGKTNHYSSNAYDPPTIGDTLTANVMLPSDKKILPGSLCFYSYNMDIEILSMDNRVLYQYHPEEGSIMTGHLLVRIDIPNIYWGHSIRIVQKPLEKNTGSRLNDVYIVSSEQSSEFPAYLSGKFSYLLLIVLFFLSLMFLLIFLTMKIAGGDTLQGIWLSLFLISASLWALGYTGLIYMASDNVRLNAIMEYPAIYLMLPMVSGYFYFEAGREFSKKIYRYLTIFGLAYAGTATLGSVFGWPLNYLTMLYALRILLALSLVSWVVTVFLERKHGDIVHMIQGSGFLVTLVLSLLELARIRFNESRFGKLPFLDGFLKFQFVPVISVVFVTTFLVSYLVRLASAFGTERERIRLKDIAGRDPLTGIPNRYSIDTNLAKLEETGAEEYTMIFFDANDLKKANDNYGHDAGDLYLKMVGHAMYEAFSERKGFFGRNGGDEFVACVYRKADAEAGIRAFDRSVSQTNSQKLLPFPMSVAVGTSEHLPGDTRTPKQTLKDADAAMYEVKVQMKGKENVR